VVKIVQKTGTKKVRHCKNELEVVTSCPNHKKKGNRGGRSGTIKKVGILHTMGGGLNRFKTQRQIKTRTTQRNKGRLGQRRGHKKRRDPLQNPWGTRWSNKVKQ